MKTVIEQHATDKQWLSELQFVVDELQVLQHLLERNIVSAIQHGKRAELDAIRGKIMESRKEALALVGNVETHEANMGYLVDEGYLDIEDREVKAHPEWQQDIQMLEAALKELKKEVFNFLKAHPKKDVVPSESIEELHAEHREWLSMVLFMEKEIDFFRKLALRLEIEVDDPSFIQTLTAYADELMDLRQDLEREELDIELSEEVMKFNITAQSVDPSIPSQANPFEERLKVDKMMIKLRTLRESIYDYIVTTKKELNFELN